MKPITIKIITTILSLILVVSLGLPILTKPVEAGSCSITVNGSAGTGYDFSYTYNPASAQIPGGSTGNTHSQAWSYIVGPNVVYQGVGETFSIPANPPDGTINISGEYDYNYSDGSLYADPFGCSQPITGSSPASPTPPPSSPDLIPENLTVSGNPTVGQPVSFTAMTRNIGSAFASSTITALGIHKGGTWLLVDSTNFPTGTLQPNQTATHNATNFWTPPSDAGGQVYCFGVFTDFPNTLQESNEGNNYAETCFTVLSAGSNPSVGPLIISNAGTNPASGVARSGRLNGEGGLGWYNPIRVELRGNTNPSNVGLKEYNVSFGSTFTLRYVNGTASVVGVSSNIDVSGDGMSSSSAAWIVTFHQGFGTRSLTTNGWVVDNNNLSSAVTHFP